MYDMTADHYIDLVYNLLPSPQQKHLLTKHLNHVVSYSFTSHYSTSY